MIEKIFRLFDPCLRGHIMFTDILTGIRRLIISKYRVETIKQPNSFYQIHLRIVTFQDIEGLYVRRSLRSLAIVLFWLHPPPPLTSLPQPSAMMASSLPFSEFFFSLCSRYRLPMQADGRMGAGGGGVGVGDK